MTSRSRLIALAMVAALFTLSASCSGCATLGGVQQPVYVSLDTAKTVLQTVQRGEIKLVCGRPGAPPEGACVPIPLHHTIEGYIFEAAEYGQKISDIMADLPEGAPTPAEAISLAVKVGDLVRKIVASLPKSPQADELAARVAAR